MEQRLLAAFADCHATGASRPASAARKLEFLSAWRLAAAMVVVLAAAITFYPRPEPRHVPPPQPADAPHGGRRPQRRPNRLRPAAPGAGAIRSRLINWITNRDMIQFMPRSLENSVLVGQPINQGLVQSVRLVGEYRGKQALFKQQSPQVLQALRENAVIQSTESSNRIEGVVAPLERIRDLVSHRTTPANRSEQEIGCTPSSARPSTPARSSRCF